VSMTADQPAASGNRRMLVILAVGGAVAVALGVYGNVHDPSGRSLVTLFFSAGINLKVWLASVAVVFAVAQVVLALRMYGKLGSKPAAEWLGSAHRISGTLAFLFTLPVSYHCLWALGFHADSGARVLIHSIAGCFFYGAFAAKVLSVRSRKLPDWSLPVVGGAVFTGLALAWFTSSYWFFTNVDFPGF